MVFGRKWQLHIYLLFASNVHRTRAREVWLRPGSPHSTLFATNELLAAVLGVLVPWCSGATWHCTVPEAHSCQAVPALHKSGVKEL